ncbi:DEAD-box ATP-dependent RNA helicase 16 [Hordeum vulgare]|nr:DEAD-box ATP-dependent RNA helicase 16 [Hordeum vulgare]
MAGILAWAADVVGGPGDSDDEAAAERERTAAMTINPDIDKLRTLLLHNPFVLTLTEVGHAKDGVVPKIVQQFWVSIFCFL